MSAYYNEHDRFAVAWLRELIKAGELPDGDVDERDIEDVVPSELLGYRQCHFFAGIGGWPYALRLAGWPDDRPVWTGSCPCQPFSAAGKGAGFADERHLWPSWHWLIAQCRPERIYGEQVASGPGLVWLDLVSADLEALIYALTAVDLPSASVGATDIRQRLFWMADADAKLVQRGGLVGPRWWFEPAVGRAVCDCGHRSDQHRFGIDECLECSCTFWLADTECGRRGTRRTGGADGASPVKSDRYGAIERLGDADGAKRWPLAEGRSDVFDGPDARWEKAAGRSQLDREACGLADSDGERRDGLGLRLQPGRPQSARAETGGRSETGRLGDAGGQGSQERSGHGRIQRPALDASAREAAERDGDTRRLVNALHAGRTEGRAESGSGPAARRGEPRGLANADGVEPGDGGVSRSGRLLQPAPDAPVGGVWASADWIPCRDGKWRPVEPGTFPLAHGIPGRVGRLRGYGNAINPWAAAAFIRATEEALKSSADWREEAVS